MTHEEIIAVHAAEAIRSYRDVPQIWYHLQIKERDEPRPQAGVLRTREFIMKDSYTLDRDRDGPRRRATPSTRSRTTASSAAPASGSTRSTPTSA